MRWAPLLALAIVAGSVAPAGAVIRPATDAAMGAPPPSSPDDDTTATTEPPTGTTSTTSTTPTTVAPTSSTPPDSTTPASTGPDATTVSTPPTGSGGTTSVPTSAPATSGPGPSLLPTYDAGTDTTVGPSASVPPVTDPPVADPPAPAALDIRVLPAQVQFILATIRYLESGGNYDAPPNKGRASGAYQYIPSTWANHGGFEHAYLAPPWVQDERAAADVLAILARFGNDVSMVPIIWYYPFAATDPALLDIVPKPHLGNRLTVREYQTRWLQIFAFISGGPIPISWYGLPEGLELLTGIPPIVPSRLDEDGAASVSIAFPVLGPVAMSPPEPCEEGCDLAPQSVVLYGRSLQPVLAAADGVITVAQPGDLVSGDVRLMITDVDGFSYRYSGLNADQPGTDDGLAPRALRFTSLVDVGRTVRAGQIVGFMGTSDPISTDGDHRFVDDDEPVWPHLRFAITDPNGAPVDAWAPLVDAVFRQSCTVGIGQWSTAPWFYPSGIDEAIEVAIDDDGGWQILPSGVVHAVGDAALVYPTDGCQWTPELPYGPGARGSADVPEGFYDEIELPLVHWIAALKDAGEVRPGAPIRRG